MVEMAGIVTDLVDVRADLAGNAVVLLEVHRQHDTARLRANLLECRNFLFIVERDPHDPRSGAGELMRLPPGLIDVPRARRAHRLYDDWRVAADLECADVDLPRRAARPSLFHHRQLRSRAPNDCDLREDAVRRPICADRRSPPSRSRSERKPRRPAAPSLRTPPPRSPRRSRPACSRA